MDGQTLVIALSGVLFAGAVFFLGIKRALNNEIAVNEGAKRSPSGDVGPVMEGAPTTVEGGDFFHVTASTGEQRDELVLKAAERKPPVAMR